MAAGSLRWPGLVLHRDGAHLAFLKVIFAQLQARTEASDPIGGLNCEFCFDTEGDGQGTAEPVGSREALPAYGFAPARPGWQSLLRSCPVAAFQRQVLSIPGYYGGKDAGDRASAASALRLKVRLGYFGCKSQHDLKEAVG